MIALNNSKGSQDALVKQISDSVKIPMGRKIRQAIIIEKKKAALKAAKGLSR